MKYREHIVERKDFINKLNECATAYRGDPADQSHSAAFFDVLSEASTTDLTKNADRTSTNRVLLILDPKRQPVEVAENQDYVGAMTNWIKAAHAISADVTQVVTSCDSALGLWKENKTVVDNLNAIKAAAIKQPSFE